MKLDTGMGRFGFLPQDVTEAAALLKSLPSLRVEGCLPTSPTPPTKP